jgi:endonuclease-3
MMASEPGTLPKAQDRDYAAEVYHRLLARYGAPDWRPYYAPMDELILTILSQNTNDVNSLRAFRAMQARYPTWQAVMDAPTAELQETISSAGLAEIKAPRIQAALVRIKEERGDFTIDFLADLPEDEAMAWLTSFHGIGHKTASLVLLFCFGKATFPVDTHIWRISRRLGLGGPKASAEKFKAIWEQLTPPEWYYPLHLDLLRHGRETCHAYRPACGHCVLYDLCEYEDKNPTIVA